MSSIMEATLNETGTSTGDSSKGSRSDIVIIVMGAAGVGKSYFMQKLLSALGSMRKADINSTLATRKTGFNVKPIVIHPLERYAIAKRYSHLEGLGKRIVVVEAQGFDPGETAKGCTDFDKLKGLASWLSETWFSKGTISQANIGGIIYLHDVSLDRASSDIPERYFNVINQLLGFDIPLASVVLATTKWGLTVGSTVEKFASREEELKSKHWQRLLTPTGSQQGSDGARMVRFGADTQADEMRDTLDILHLVLRQADMLTGKRFQTTCLQASSAIKGQTIRDRDFTKALVRALEKSMGISRQLSRVEELEGSSAPLNSNRNELAQRLKESVEDLSNLKSELTSFNKMHIVSLEILSTLKTLLYKMYLP